MPFWLKSKALTWANPERAPSWHSIKLQLHARRRGSPLLPSPSIQDYILERWWYITARALLIAYQKRFWGLIGNYLQNVAGVPPARLAGTRRSWGVGRGRLFRNLSDYAPK